MSSKKPYYGPAGIFSTDNAEADQRQIDAESYDPDEDGMDGNPQNDPYEEEDDRYIEKDLVETIRVFFSCSVRTDPGVWYSSKTVFTEELEVETASAQKEHDLACSCGKPISVSPTD